MGDLRRALLLTAGGLLIAFWPHAARGLGSMVLPWDDMPTVHQLSPATTADIDQCGLTTGLDQAALRGISMRLVVRDGRVRALTMPARGLDQPVRRVRPALTRCLRGVLRAALPSVRRGLRTYRIDYRPFSSIELPMEAPTVPMERVLTAAEVETLLTRMQAVDVGERMALVSALEGARSGVPVNAAPRVLAAFPEYERLLVGGRLCRVVIGDAPLEVMSTVLRPLTARRLRARTRGVCGTTLGTP